MHAGDSLQNAVNVKDPDNHFGRNAKTYKCFFFPSFSRLRDKGEGCFLSTRSVKSTDF